MSARCYLDHAANSPMPAEVVAAMSQSLGMAGNPSSLHQAGRTARRLLEEARESLAADLGAHPTEVVFTSGGTITALLHLITGVTAEKAFELNWQIVNTSLSRLKFRGSDVALASYNSHTHLELLKAPELITFR